MIDIEETRATAGLLAARAIREMDPRKIEALHPNADDALRIYEAILTADIHLEWPRPQTGRKAKVVAVVSSPLLVPILAIMWLTWRLERGIRRLLGKGKPPRKHRRP